MSAPASLVRRHASAIAERWPRGYRLALIARHRNSPFLRRIISPGHDLVIEGFPRTASSFALRAFMFANGWRDPRVATHVHSPAQVVLAARWGVPALVTIRPPEAAVVGWMAYASQFGQLPAGGPSARQARAWIGVQTRRYARFYETIAPLSAHFVLTRFCQTTGDFGAVIARLNARFGREFDLFEHVPANQRRIFAQSRAHLSPDPRRDALKHCFLAHYRAEENAAARRRAERAYQQALVSAGAEPPRSLLPPAPAAHPA